MRKVTVACLFLASFAVFLAVGFPLSLAAKIARLDDRGVWYEAAYGTVWEGVLSGVNVAGQPVGMVEMKVQPPNLLHGLLSYSFNAKGDFGDGRGDVGVTAGRRIVVERLVADVNVQKLAHLDPRLRRAPATLALSVPMLEFSSRDGCREAKGALTSDILQTVGRQWNWDGPKVSGDLKCINGRLNVTVHNEGGADDILATGIFGPLGNYDVKARIGTRNSSLAQALTRIGFTTGPEGLTYEKSSGTGL